MSINLAALELLLPEKGARKPLEKNSLGTETTLGPVPYDAIMASSLGGFSADFMDAIEAVRSDPRWGPVYRGDLAAYDGDHSAADLALCGQFARLGMAAPMVDTAFRTSALYREKWERTNYSESTIELALKGKKVLIATEI